jgi:hypothetical protein
MRCSLLHLYPFLRFKTFVKSTLGKVHACREGVLIVGIVERSVIVSVRRWVRFVTRGCVLIRTWSQSSPPNSLIHSSVVLQPFVGPWPLLQFRKLFYVVGRTPWTSDQPVARPLPTHRTTQTQNKCTQTSMPWVGFEPTIPMSERAKTVYALDRTATVSG